MKINKKIIAISLSLILGFTSIRAISFTDAPAQVQRHAQYIENLKRWSESIEQYKRQVELLKNNLASVTGVKDIYNIIDNIKNNKFLDTLASINNINSIERGFDALDTKTKEIFIKNGIGKSCKNKADIKVKLCEGEILYNIGSIKARDDFTNDINDIYQKLIKLSDEAKKSADLKTSTDINNQINILNSVLNLKVTQYSIIRDNEKQVLKLIEAKNNEATNKISNTYKSNNSNANNNSDILEKYNKPW